MPRSHAAEPVCFPFLQATQQLLIVCPDNAGDKTIFSYLGLGRDRNTIRDWALVLGIPGMFADIRRKTGQDEQLLHHYNRSIEKLAFLMTHKDTALKWMVDFWSGNPFPDAEHNLKQLAEALHGWFHHCHPFCLPVCSGCTTSSDHAEVPSPILVISLVASSIIVLIAYHMHLHECSASSQSSQHDRSL